MTSRRCIVIEDGAREQLLAHGYTVRVIPHGFNKKQPPGHLVATHPSGEVRLIRIWKITNQPSTIEFIEQKCRVSVKLFRKHMSRQMLDPPSHYEIWIYTISYGFRCFEVLKDKIRETPKFSLNGPGVPCSGGIA